MKVRSWLTALSSKSWKASPKSANPRDTFEKSEGSEIRQHERQIRKLQGQLHGMRRGGEVKAAGLMTFLFGGLVLAGLEAPTFGVAPMLFCALGGVASILAVNQTDDVWAQRKVLSQIQEHQEQLQRLTGQG